MNRSRQSHHFWLAIATVLATCIAGFSLRAQTPAAPTPGGTPAQRAGAAPTTIIALAKPVQARFIKITETGTAVAGELWGIQQVRVYRTGK